VKIIRLLVILQVMKDKPVTKSENIFCAIVYLLLIDYTFYDYCISIGNLVQ